MSFTGRKKINRGFTLLETMVAVAVLLTAIVGPVVLITRGIIGFSFSKNKLVAINLSQEGVELVRVVRDNNIICDILNGPANFSWNSDPGGGVLTSTAREADVLSTVTLTCGSVSLATPRLPVYAEQKLRFDPTTGIYSYTGTQETMFVRRIDIKTPPDGPDSGITAGDQMDVISTVTWSERGITRNVVLRERLYNWR